MVQFVACVDLSAFNMLLLHLKKTATRLAVVSVPLHVCIAMLGNAVVVTVLWVWESPGLTSPHDDFCIFFLI